MRFSSENVYKWKYNEAKKLGYVAIYDFKGYIKTKWVVESYSIDFPLSTDSVYLLYLINKFVVFI